MQVITPLGEQIVNPTFAVQIDDSASPVTYIGKAKPGSLSSAAVWQIKKMDETSGLIITFADGNANYDNVWNNRASLSYS